MSQSSLGPWKINVCTAYIQTWFINCKFQVFDFEFTLNFTNMQIINLLLLCFNRCDDCFICLPLTVTNPCDASPCNTGSCTRTGLTTFSCMCPADYTGANCESESLHLHRCACHVCVVRTCMLTPGSYH